MLSGSTGVDGNHRSPEIESDDSIDPAAFAFVNLDHAEITRIVSSVAGGSRNVQHIYPLSPLQEGMLFHHLLNPGSDTYVLATLFDVQSAEHVRNLLDALQKVIARHEILRAAVLWHGLSRPVQVVLAKVHLQVERLQAAENPLAQLRARMQPGHEPMNLQQAPLMRLILAEASDGATQYALLQIHHLICDYRSWHCVIDEMLECLQGRESELPPPAAYREYVASSLASRRTGDAEAFFRARLSDIREPTAPFGSMDVHGHGGRLKESREPLEPADAHELRVQARRLGVTPARLLHAAWALVVAATSGRDEVIFGTALMAGQRRSSQADRMIGLFVNTLPLRLRLDGVSASELVDQTCRELEELVQFEATPLTLAQRCASLAGTTPLFTSLLNCRRTTPAAPRASTTPQPVRVLAHHDAWTNYPVTLTVDEQADVFTLTAQTECSIDPRRVTAYMRTAIRSLVHALQVAPHTQALSLAVLPESELQQVLLSFNDTQAEGSRDKLIHRLFEEQVERTPNATAVTHDRHSLTYTQLNCRANQVARYLRDCGVGAGHLAALCMARGIGMLEGLLGILKAGAAYVPIDPSYPRDRLRYMLEDAAPTVVLTQEGLRELLPGACGPVVTLDGESQQIAAYAQENLRPDARELNPDSLVYVIYTSGSTGRPKGTAMPHRSMVNLIEWHRRALPVAGDERVLQYAALSFDVAFQEIFSTLCAGGTLVLLDEATRRDARALLRLLNEERVTRLFIPPVMLQAVAECYQTSPMRDVTLRDVITAGEQLRISTEIVGLFHNLDGCRLHNHYGPTETHVVTALTLKGRAGTWPALPAIGAPIANTQVYLLDRHGKPAPLGIAGEICLAGANLAAGYLRRAELTAQRFVRNPFDSQHSVMYRTGDLGRWCLDGTIEYLGRNDDQVKIRGHRVELGEVEAQLARHPAVLEAAVAAQLDDRAEMRLVAYVTTRGGARIRAEELHAHLLQSLPDYMVPSAFVILDTLPLTPSGKLNRRALPAPHADAYVHQRYETPRGNVEQALARIWQQLLAVDTVGRGDNFFELGGHSLHGMRLAAAIERDFAVRMSVAVVFQYPTIEKLAPVIAEAQWLAGQSGFAAPPATDADVEQGVIAAGTIAAGSLQPERR